MSTFCFTSKSGNILSNLRSMITRSFLSPSLFNSSNWGVVRVLRRRREPAVVPRSSTAKGRGPMATKAVIFFSAVLILCAFVSTRWINNAVEAVKDVAGYKDAEPFMEVDTMNQDHVGLYHKIEILKFNDNNFDTWRVEVMGVLTTSDMEDTIEDEEKLRVFMTRSGRR